MGMNARAVRKGFAFSSTPDMALLGGGTETKGERKSRIKRKWGSGSQGESRRSVTGLAESGHIIGHVTKQ